MTMDLTVTGYYLVTIDGEIVERDNNLTPDYMVCKGIDSADQSLLVITPYPANIRADVGYPVTIHCYDVEFNGVSVLPCVPGVSMIARSIAVVR